MIFYRVLADVVLLLHFAYVTAVVFGFLAIVMGLARGRRWARNPWIRLGHLAMIGIVVAQAWAGIVCPLTKLENTLRKWGGQESYPLDFLEFWFHRLMFFRAPPWAFILAYSLFGLAVAATFALGPPRFGTGRIAGAAGSPELPKG